MALSDNEVLCIIALVSISITLCCFCIGLFCGLCCLLRMMAFKMKKPKENALDSEKNPYNGLPTEPEQHCFQPSAPYHPLNNWGIRQGYELPQSNIPMTSAVNGG
jgi:hypothetical protein